jgi:hypothetical protein
MKDARISYRLICIGVALVAGCGGVRNKATTLGNDIIAGLKDQEPELFELERRLADSAATFVGRAVEDKVLTRASGVWDTMLLKVNDQSRLVVGRMAQGVERDLNRSLQVTLDENFRLADSSGRVMVARLVNSALGAARANSQPMIDEVMAALEKGLRGRLRPVLIEVIGEAGDSLARRIDALDSMLAKSKTGRGVSNLLWGLVIALGIIVIGGGIVWRRHTARTQRAFKVAMNATTSSKPAVQQELRRQGFGRQADWLE